MSRRKGGDGRGLKDKANLIQLLQICTYSSVITMETLQHPTPIAASAVERRRAERVSSGDVTRPGLAMCSELTWLGERGVGEG